MKEYKQIHGKTTEDLIESIDACIDNIMRKPRKIIEVNINQTPGGCQLRNVAVEDLIGVGFYVIAGTLKHFTIINPANTKDLKVSIIRSKDETTSYMNVELKATTEVRDIVIEAGTEVFIKLMHATLTSIPFLTIGFVFEPKGP